MHDISSFYVVTREPGAEHPSLPTWANRAPNPMGLAESISHTVERREIPEVPGAFQLLNVLTAEECQAFIDATEALEYLPDAAVSLPRQVRHNDNITWVVDELTDKLIWGRCQHLMQGFNGIYGDRAAKGINARFRFYRYSEGDYFQFHRDGAWPGSRVIDDELVMNAYPNLFSEMTFLILLSEDFEGGYTRFRLQAEEVNHSENQSAVVDVRTPAGSVLCFPHGTHPMHRIHSSTPITKGVKYIIRTDTLFQQR